ncbi:hypothetical protein UFOVP1492_54 [uncultured Caudovirales phage]|uniref:Uncharacterized protein n=1 Tax=uncultured Caudovirales phage TaxID=2100421 RepID=A0A6J5QSE4_9CAUD|nr:hypothetical protein UFOVP1127_80 [uncultured Caudovirales phage]CAB4193692.1 hypothetical protein UFOVP1242_130 [uncultured Caudovirales phage]CAB4217640.1 hypothetical protein UFOVP1492_54 [uncultured Caudovirales phage]CAB5231447.1 hypothetical protein UFOVP1580_83 [uncultured Caudovirales phage]
MPKVKTVKGRQWTVELIRKMMEESDKALCTGLVQIYKQQTADEKEAQSTHYVNGRGFNSSDANFLSSCAQAYETYGYLFKEQIVWVRKSMLKYAGQLFNLLVEDAVIPTYDCTLCGWTGIKGDLQMLSVESTSKEKPGDYLGCPNCCTDTGLNPNPNNEEL